MFGDFFLLVRLYDTMQSYMIHFVLREKFLTNFPMGSQVLQVLQGQGKGRAFALAL